MTIHILDKNNYSAPGAAPCTDLLEVTRAGQNGSSAALDRPSGYSHLNSVELLKLHDPARALALLAQSQLPTVPNTRVRFNPMNRHTTRARRKPAGLFYDGYSPL